MKKIPFLALALTFALFCSCGDNSKPKQDPLDTPPPTVDTAKVQSAYICPCGHCGFEGSKDPGECPKCGMELQASK
jgi:hypothetical protein